MYTISLLTAFLAATAMSSPIARQASKNKFSITNFVFGCTTTCDWSFNVVNTNSVLPGHPGFTTSVHCNGSKESATSFSNDTCGFINDKQRVAAFIDANNTLNLQYRVQVPQEGFPGATYWYEGGQEVGAATGYNPSPPTFDVPETKAYSIA